MSRQSKHKRGVAENTTKLVMALHVRAAEDRVGWWPRSRFVPLRWIRATGYGPYRDTEITVTLISTSASLPLQSC